MPEGRKTKTAQPRPAAKRHSDQLPEPQDNQERPTPPAATEGQATAGKQHHNGREEPTRERMRAAARAAKEPRKPAPRKSEALKTVAHENSETAAAGTPEPQEVRTLTESQPPTKPTPAKRADAAGTQTGEGRRQPPKPNEVKEARNERPKTIE